MVESTKIKLLGVVGTFTIISASYLLHAKAFYNEIYPSVDTNEQITSTSMPAKEPVEMKTIDVSPNPQEPVAIAALKPEVPLSKEIIEPKAAAVVSSSDTLGQLLQRHKYFHVEKSGEISEDSKAALEKILPLLKDINNSYIELEGHSATQTSSALSQKMSEQYAHSIQRYLNDKKISKEIVVTGHGDMYPIFDDTKNKHNSRVVVKIRRR